VESTTFWAPLYDSTGIAGVDYDPQTQDYEPNELDAADDLEIINPSDVEDNLDENEDEDDEDVPPLVERSLKSYESNDKEEDDEESDNEAPKESHQVTRTGRISRPAVKFADEQARVYFEQEESNQYSAQTARIIANVMHDLNQARVDDNNKNNSFIQAYSLKPGLKFKDKGRNAAFDKMQQLHDRGVLPRSSIRIIPS
jgi:hypothetical protein